MAETRKTDEIKRLTAQLDRAVKCLDTFTVSPEDAQAMRDYVMTGKRNA